MFSNFDQQPMFSKLSLIVDVSNFDQQPMFS